MIVIESDRFKSLKGFCFISCQTTYVVINTFLADAVKQIVASHELAHIVLHRNQLKIAPMKDTVLYDMASQTEYEANLFAADLLLDDEEIHKLSQDEDMSDKCPPFVRGGKSALFSSLAARFRSASVEDCPIISSMSVI